MEKKGLGLMLLFILEVLNWRGREAGGSAWCSSLRSLLENKFGQQLVVNNHRGGDAPGDRGMGTM